MDEEEFLPLRLDELTGLDMARRFLNFSNLPFDITARAVGSHLCIEKREVNYRHGSGIYIQIAGFTAWIGFDASLWRKWGISPIWAEFVRQSCPIAEVRKRLNSFRTLMPPRCFDASGGNCVAVPIILSAGVEKQQIIDDAVRQLGELKAKLEPLGPIDETPELLKDNEPDATPGCDSAVSPTDGVGTEVVLEIRRKDGHEISSSNNQRS